MMLFQEFIKFSLGKGEKLSQRLTEQDWLSLYAEAQRQSLFGVFMDGVERAVALGEGKPKCLLQWIAQVMALEQRNKLLDAKAAELTRLFADDGFRSCILKGQGVAKLYPHPYFLLSIPHCSLNIIQRKMGLLSPPLTSMLYIP